jgi:tRNA-(ms[2]io[6]A)-hydroxylase
MATNGKIEILLQIATTRDWVEAVMADLDRFLLDHAAAEKKASAMAMTLISHYPDRPELVNAMVDLALEELTHFRAVVKLIAERGLQLVADEKDQYVNSFRKAMRRGKDEFLMDRLLVAGIIEARGAERFGLVADALDAGPLKRFYRSITRSEKNHQNLFVDLALVYAPVEQVQPRLQELLAIEAEVVKTLPIRPALH